MDTAHTQVGGIKRRVSVAAVRALALLDVTLVVRVTP